MSKILKQLKIVGLVLLLALTLQSNSAIVYAGEKSNVGGDFTLTDHNGKKFELQQLRGKLVLIFFGYTFCPDICPTELSSLAKVLRSLGDDAEKVSALFISVDPERDTPDKLKNYVPFFSPNLIGLTGSESEISAVADAYRVQTKIHSKKKDSEYYLVDHSANLYVLGADGKMLNIIPFGLPTEHILQVVKNEINHLNKL
ncbi:SCO family protein [uncultured Cocleimonas sp.]|uniref:SCO family protein n=1 Tax=uncultured Cocleimonas sp. TaxID=1051587 RepID=UPI00262D92EC|nr:SCO family protein [uncultured Cocleimonas sp.]